MGETVFPLKSGGGVILSPRETSLCGECYFKPGGPGSDCTHDKNLFVDNKSVPCGMSIFKFVPGEHKPEVKSNEFSSDGVLYKRVPDESKGTCEGCSFWSDGSPFGCTQTSLRAQCTITGTIFKPVCKSESEPELKSCIESDYIKIPCSNCSGCVFGDGRASSIAICKKPGSFSGCGSFAAGGVGIIFKHKSDYIITPKLEPEPEPARKSEPEVMTKEILERDYVKVPKDGCQGCALAEGSRCIIAGLYIRSCGSDSNCGASMQYRLKSSLEPRSDYGGISKPIEPELITSDGKYVRFLKRGCPGCCFTNPAGIGCTKPSTYPPCCMDDSDKSYQFRPVQLRPVTKPIVEEEEDEEIVDDPENLDYEYELDGGGVVMAVRDHDCCTGCYFYNTHGRACAKSLLLSDDPPCSGVKYDLVEDPPTPEEKEPSSNNGMTYYFDKGSVVIKDSHSDNCDKCYFYQAHSTCKKPGTLPSCTYKIFVDFKANEEEVTEPKKVLEIIHHPEFGQIFETIDGTEVVVCEEDVICNGCYFKRTGHCTQNEELGKDIKCGGIIFKPHGEEDPSNPEWVDDGPLGEEGENWIPEGGIISFDGMTDLISVRCKVKGSCDGCWLDDDCQDPAKFCSPTTIFKLYTKPEGLEFRKETRLEL